MLLQTATAILRQTRTDKSLKNSKDLCKHKIIGLALYQHSFLSVRESDQAKATKFNLLLSHCEPTQKLYAALFLLPLSQISDALWVFCKTLSINKKRTPNIQHVKLRKKDCLNATPAEHVYIYTLSCKSDSLFSLSSSSEAVLTLQYWADSGFHHEENSSLSC